MNSWNEVKCKIEICGEFSARLHASFTMLYSPLLGSNAVMLYHTLLAIGTRSKKIKNHLLITQITGMSQSVFDKNRQLLEQYLLVKTYYRTIDNSYIYQLFMPKDGLSFLRHEVFGRAYMKKMGKQVFEFSKLCFAYDVEDKQNYQDITTPFHSAIFQDWQEQEEEQFTSLKPVEMFSQNMEFPIHFNYDRFLDNLSYTIFPRSARNEKNLKVIGELATIYGIDEMKMRRLVSNSMNLKDGSLNIESLKRKVRNAKDEWKQELVKDPYLLPPVRFLQDKQQGVKVSATDKYLIESLIHDYKMQPEVVNVLIEHVLDSTNQQFPTSYVEKVASTWVRLKIDTKEKALALISEEPKQVKMKNNNKKALPTWYHDQDSIAQPEETVNDDELKRLMEQLRGEA